MLDGSQSEVGRLRRLVLKHARDAFGDPATVDRNWKGLGYEAPLPEYVVFKVDIFAGSTRQMDRKVATAWQDAGGPSGVVTNTTSNTIGGVVPEVRSRVWPSHGRTRVDGNRLRSADCCWHDD